MRAWLHQAEEVPRLLRGHRGLWWEPGVGKTLPLATAGRDLGLPQLWLTLSQGGLLTAQTAAALPVMRGDRPRVQLVRSGRDTIDSRADVVVCSYDLARTLPIWRQLVVLSWGSLVLDEAHALGNSASTRTRSIYGAKRESKGALYRRAAHVWPATGTPILNDPSELWPHVSRLWPEIATRTKGDWIDEYCLTRRGDFGLQIIGARNLPALRERLRGVSSVRLLAEVQADIPPLLVDTVDIEISAATRAEIERSLETREAREAFASVMAEIEGGEAWDEMVLQAAAVPLAGVRRLVGLAKAQSVAELVRGELQGGVDRVLVFGLHVEALAVLRTLLAAYRPGLLNGTVTPAARAAAVDAFVAGTSRVLVANIDAAGIGLNLQACRRVVFLEAKWTPGPNHQAIARAYRAGQTRPVHVTYTAVARSIDRAVTGVLARKARIIKEIMNA